MTDTANITLIARHNSSNPRSELRIARNEIAINEIRETTAHGTNVSLTRIDMSRRMRPRPTTGIADKTVKIVKMIEATTREVCRRVSFDNIGS